MADELRPHIRCDAPPDDTTVVVRGGPNTADKLARHAVRTNRAYQLDGQPFWGVSVFLALDESGEASLDGLLNGRLRTYRVVHTPKLEQGAGCRLRGAADLSPAALHVGPARRRADDVRQLLSALGPDVPNPYYEGGRRR